MLRVTLKTSDGALVHRTEIPPFNKYPDVLLWGDRIFYLRNREDQNSLMGTYIEAFAYAITGEEYASRTGT